MVRKEENFNAGISLQHSKGIFWDFQVSKIQLIISLKLPKSLTLREESDKLVNKLKESNEQAINIIPVSSTFALNSVCGTSS